MGESIQPRRFRVVGELSGDFSPSELDQVTDHLADAFAARMKKNMGVDAAAISRVNVRVDEATIVIEFVVKAETWSDAAASSSAIIDSVVRDAGFEADEFETASRSRGTHHLEKSGTRLVPA